jgi:hypothetical protein
MISIIILDINFFTNVMCGITYKQALFRLNLISEAMLISCGTETMLLPKYA